MAFGDTLSYGGHAPCLHSTVGIGYLLLLLQVPYVRIIISQDTGLGRGEATSNVDLSMSADRQVRLSVYSRQPCMHQELLTSFDRGYVHENMH